MHNVLTEKFTLGLTDMEFNSPASPDFQPGLLPYDLTRGGHPFLFRGHADIKQYGFFVQDTITVENFAGQQQRVSDRS